MNTELAEKFKGITETLADIKQECVMMGARINSRDEEIQSLQNYIVDHDESSEDDLLPVKNTQDELKRESCARLYKNLTLEQLENLEMSVKNSFRDSKKNYILELP